MIKPYDMRIRKLKSIKCVSLTSLLLCSCTLNEPTNVSMHFSNQEVSIEQQEANDVNDIILLNFKNRSRSNEDKYPPFYGGSYIEKDGTLTIYFLGDSMETVQQIQEITTKPIIRYIRVCHSWNELINAQENIDRIIVERKNDIFFNIVAYGVNVVENAIEMYVIGDTLEFVNRKEDLFNYANIKFLESDNFINHASNVLYPGGKLCNSPLIGQYGSIAFRARKSHDSTMVGIVSAGHVFQFSNNAYLNGTLYGNCYEKSFDNGSIVDAAFIIPEYPRPLNETTNYIGGDSTRVLSLETRCPGAGTYVNKWGAETGHSGGYIQSTNFSVVDRNDTTIYVNRDLVSATYSSSNGDSGGIVYTYYTSANKRYTVGVHKGRIPMYEISVYSKADNVLRVFNLERY